MICLAKPGDRVTKGQPLLELRTDDPGKFAAALAALDGAASVSDQPPSLPSPVIEQSARSSRGHIPWIPRGLVAQWCDADTC